MATAKAVETRDIAVRAHALAGMPDGFRVTVAEGPDPKGREVRLSVGGGNGWVYLERAGYRPVAVEVARLVAALADFQEGHPAKRGR